MTNEDELGGSFDKTVIGPYKRGSAHPSEVAGSTSLGEPTVLLTDRGAAVRLPARPASGQETVFLAKRPNSEKILPERNGQPNSIGQIFSALEPCAAGPNLTLAAANPILAATARLRRGWPTGPLPELRDSFARAIEYAVTALKRSGLPDDDIRRTKLVLCELIDETILDLGASDADYLARDGMMQTFFQTGYTGTGFFEILNELLADPQAHRDILEFMHACLCFGFMGQYRGRREAGLDRIRDDLRDTLRAPSTGHSLRLSRPAAPEKRAAAGWTTLLAISLGAATITGAIYLGMGLVLEREASAVAVRLDALGSLAATAADDAAVTSPAGNGARDLPELKLSRP